MDKSKLTFSQAQGLEPLPAPLILGALPNPARVQIWTVFYKCIENSKDKIQGYFLVGHWLEIFQDAYLEILNIPPDESEDIASDHAKIIKKLVYKDKYNRVFDLLQYIMRHSSCPKNFIFAISLIFEKNNLAYVVVMDPPTIIPRSTPEEGVIVENALQELRQSGLSGARRHLLDAGANLSSGRHHDAIRESIHAVESVARSLNENSKTSLGPALKALEQKGIEIHPSLKQAMEKMYGYTSDEEGIRHSFLTEQSTVDLADALFMFGACASFVSYLLSKGRAAGLLAKLA